MPTLPVLARGPTNEEMAADWPGIGLVIPEPNAFMKKLRDHGAFCAVTDFNPAPFPLPMGQSKVVGLDRFAFAAKTRFLGAVSQAGIGFVEGHVGRDIDQELFSGLVQFRE